ncbi:hypothetical protein FH972_022128 [Carpinus fangiana]|uniref:Tubby C-terminal domain-containing protein n=1 Tax=Carpinus fangiana TaxID=176857 RepID=A0A5N6KRZ1_9ROSI|nr:hypothetical protein FH972_022128 [Carpinus fangiana]
MVHQLQACNPPLGPQPPNPAFYSPKQQTLQMKEKVFSLSGDDFTVKTVEGTEICKCKGKVMSISDKKKFTDIQGNEIFTLSNKLLSIHKSFHAEAPGKADFEVKGHFSLLSSKSSVHFTNAADGQQVELEVKGDWFDRSATITYGGRPVAQIQRSFMNYRQIFGDKQTYYVLVAPNVDLSMIAGVCICLDEKENEK